MTFRILMVDVDGVVVRQPPGRWRANLATDLGLASEDLQEHFFGPHWKDVTLGHADILERLALVLSERAPHLSPETLLAYWFERDSDVDRALLADLATLRATGIPVHLCTTQEHRRADHLWNTVGLKDHFDGMHYAAAYGVAKPERAFFDAVAKAVHSEAGDLMLLDDYDLNVLGARAAGWQARLWTGENSLTEVLQASS